MLMGVGVVVGMFSEGCDRLAAAHLLRSFTFPGPFGLEPVVLFGVFLAVGNLLGMALMQRLERTVETTSSLQLAMTLSLLTTMVSVAVLLFALSFSVWLAILAYVLLIPIRQSVDLLTTAWINQHIDSDVRATVLSMRGQADALGQMSGSLVGLVGQLAGLRVALTCSALLLVPAITLYMRSLRSSPHSD
ncbi:MAG: hypothetical protein CBC10_007200 [Gammaproteobacteria bacterium TMED50]|nr:MAG: hypothetical protein CBC10_007200 [Gammaproteobacteria bacterium TMED50]